MRFILAIMCFIAFINGANATIVPDLHGKFPLSAESNHADHAHSHSEGSHSEDKHSKYVHLTGHTDGKCHTGCSMRSATLHRRNEDVVAPLEYELQIILPSFLSILNGLFEASSFRKETGFTEAIVDSSLPVYAYTQRFRI